MADIDNPERHFLTRAQIDIILEAITIEYFDFHVEHTVIIPSTMSIFEMNAWLRNWRTALESEFLKK